MELLDFEGQFDQEVQVGALAGASPAQRLGMAYRQCQTAPHLGALLLTWWLPL